jgi:hypothetical protein
VCPFATAASKRLENVAVFHALEGRAHERFEPVDAILDDVLGEELEQLP